MSDFTSGFWSIYITIITVVGIIGCLWLLWANMTHKTSGPAESMGHVWDEDLSELNNPLPAWWAWLFVITVVFGLSYLVLFPGLGAFGGVKKWTSHGAYEAEKKSAAERYDPLYARFSATSIEDLARDPQAHAIGERLFLNNCAQCHASDARGSKGFPNLTDSDWLWGGKPARIEETIMGGRQNQMPAWGAALGDQGVDDVAHYVLSLSGTSHDPIKAARGKANFGMCAGCHGPKGDGNPDMGTARLNDRVWLYGGSLASIKETIKNGRSSRMPNFGERLGRDRVHVLASYVWGLSNVQGAVSAQ